MVHSPLALEIRGGLANRSHATHAIFNTAIPIGDESKIDIGIWEALLMLLVYFMYRFLIRVRGIIRPSPLIYAATTSGTSDSAVSSLSLNVLPLGFCP